MKGTEIETSARDLAVGRAISLFRNSRELSSQELADLADIDILRIRRLEKGMSPIEVDEIARVANALGITSLELIAMADGISERWGKIPPPPPPTMSRPRP